MKQRKIKRYIIHILAIPAIGPDVLDIPMSKCAIIVCAERYNKYMDLFPEIQKCIVPFADVEDKRHPMAIRGAHARLIIRFLRNLPEEVTDLYVCCSKGGSRSPAVAAAVLRMSGRSDKIVWENPFYVPNRLVYQVICKEFGLFAPNWYVKQLVKLNRQCYMKATRCGDAGKYERWQIIE
jgi:hypothetical protein